MRAAYAAVIAGSLLAASPALAAEKVRFFGTVDLVNALEQEKTQGRSGQMADRLMRCDLVILDELGYLPFSASGGALL